jgi:transcriptional regulator with XRE-family HTH domain
VAELRRARGLTLSELASAAEVSVRSWQRVEVGTRPPRLDELERVARVLRIRPSRLVRDVEELAGRAAVRELLVAGGAADGAALAERIARRGGR